ncbi:hypothetical protein [Chitinophaga varians]|uniref:hypothetical protein n=1 Tax=Chitinophaga varians TaxID=2202339 RepID=UPI00165F6EBE|nr:hypothetical protein [Chitinophaga varians]MBC9911069.1 hypothetical protein [Chitinophaga varians]
MALVATFVVFHSWLKAILQGVITSLNPFKDKMSAGIKMQWIKNEQNEQILRMVNKIIGF